MVITATAQMTAQQFEEIIRSPDYAEKRLELVKGALIVMSPASVLHGIIAGELLYHIRHYVGQNKLGRVTAAETGYILSEHTVRAPDVGFIAAGRIPPEGLPDTGFTPFAPDLAVEVVSPGNTAAEIHRKVLDFLDAGTKLVWVVYPDTQSVEAHTPTGARTFRQNDTLDGGDVIPEFALPVADIFA